MRSFVPRFALWRRGVIGAKQGKTPEKRGRRHQLGGTVPPSQRLIGGNRWRC
jgi:hypothetical protein